MVTPTQYVRLSFRNVPISVREKAINARLVQEQLLNKLPIEMRELFIDSFFHPTQEKLNVLREFFANPAISIIAHHIIKHKPSSHKALEPLYDKTPEMLVDRYFFNCPAGDAIPDRLNAVVEHVPYWIMKASERTKERVKVIILGSGPAQDAIGILIKHPEFKDNVEFYCVDNEPSALELGEYLAKKNGVKEYITYIEGDMTKLNYREMDLAILVGIICPMGHLSGIRLLKNTAEYCRGGFLIVSATQQKMLFEDPVTCFAMDFGRWKLFYRTHKQLEESINRAGLVLEDHFYDPKYQYHEIAIATVPSNHTCPITGV